MRSRKTHKRAGNILVLSAFMLMGMMGFMALAIDVGYLEVANTELQRSADSAAIAATWRLLDEQGPDGTVAVDPVRAVAGDFARRNVVCNAAPGLGSSDVEIGHLGWPFAQNTMTSASGPDLNAVKVRVRRSGAQNGEVPFFFARAMGHTGTAMETEATAAFLNDIRGFRTPSDGSNLEILPFALDKQTWDNLMAGGGTDNYTYNPATKSVSCGGDGVKECNLYPQGTGSPGNRGTVDIGPSNNSTNDICRQIVYGVSPSDLAAIGGKLELGADGTLMLNGDTGISAGCKDELASIAGKPRVIPIFDSVSGNGNNAMYRIVGFVGIRIVGVKMTGGNKQVMIQPAKVVLPGGIPGNGTTTSKYVYSPVWLVR